VHHLHVDEHALDGGATSCRLFRPHSLGGSKRSDPAPLAIGDAFQQPGGYPARPNLMLRLVGGGA
jgi:hypothetical protein